ncbi:glycosyltransferase [Microbacterium marinilacus]|uniref:D-inositol 3-phosphate glycosyltransferase n=1 Tax=Microbacterium marinilacus TaxID=415209 RepID=A0ABP7BNZ4_9MICO|nr:glycosyltransferase [Microbacterium marinilacus]MBY0690063.1 glycosyltransferase [Microbacterium marinilacus]
MRVLRVAHHAVVDAWRERERALRARGHDVRLLSARRWNEGGRDLSLHPGPDGFVEGVRTVGRHPNAFLYDPRPLWRALGEPVDVIDLHEEPVSLATAEILLLRWLRRNRAPYVLYSAQNIDKRYPFPFRWLERRALRGAAGVSVCNREAGEILARKGLRTAAPVIPLGVDLEAFRPDTRVSPRRRPLIGYVGRLEAHKGVATLLRAAALRPAWHVEITGDGPARSELVALAESLGIAGRVTFLGYADGEALAGRYRRLDALAVPSVPTPGWLEQFCRVAVEAMASGVPVVASRTGAIPDVVAEAGSLVPPGDPAALAAALDEVLAPESWEQRRASGIAHAQEFTWERVAARQELLYELAAPPRAARPPQVVVVAYGDPALLDGALAGLGGGFPLTIVDNSSSEETRAIADRHGARYLDPGRNLGFGAGVNVALRDLAQRGDAGDDVLLLNPDARIDAGGVHRLQRALHDDARLAAVGAEQIDPATGSPVRVWWPFPHPARAWVEAVGLGRLTHAKGFAIGSILLLRATAIADVGMFDERFFLYAEEVDWQRRARDRAWRIDVAAVRSTHIGAATSSDGARRELLFHAAAETYVRKHFGAAGWQAYRLALLAGSAVRGAVLPGGRGASARRRRDLYARGPVAALAEAA